MASEQQAITDLPTWLLLLIALAGLVGEMRQADVPGVAMAEIIKRVMLRFGSSALFGMATLLLTLALWGDVLVAGGLGIVIGLLGADIAGALYTRYLARRAGVCDLPVKPGARGE